MTIGTFHKYAAAEYCVNVNEFIHTGEGHELTRLQNLRVRTKYPKVEQWYNSLDYEGRRRIDSFLLENYGHRLER